MAFLGCQQVGNFVSDKCQDVFNGVKVKFNFWKNKLEYSRLPPLLEEATHVPPVDVQFQTDFAALIEARAAIYNALFQQAKDGNGIIWVAILKYAGLLAMNVAPLLAINSLGIFYTMSRHPFYFLIVDAISLYLIVATAKYNNFLLNNMEPLARDIYVKQLGYRTFYRSFVCRYRDAGTAIQVPQAPALSVPRLDERVCKRPEQIFEHSVEKKLQDLAIPKPRHTMLLYKSLHWGLLIGAILLFLCINGLAWESPGIPMPPRGVHWENCTQLGYPPVLTCHAMR